MSHGEFMSLAIVMTNKAKFKNCVHGVTTKPWIPQSDSFALTLSHKKIGTLRHLDLKEIVGINSEVELENTGNQKGVLTFLSSYSELKANLNVEFRFLL